MYQVMSEAVNIAVHFFITIDIMLIEICLCKYLLDFALIKYRISMYIKFTSLNDWNMIRSF